MPAQISSDLTRHRNEGSKCGECAKTEAACALTWPCCQTCRHFRHLDSAGNEKVSTIIVGRPQRPVSSGSLQAWQRAQWRRRARQRYAERKTAS